MDTKFDVVINNGRVIDPETNLDMVRHVGISGGTAQVVGELLRELGEEQQIIAITHQSQVAAQAHQHILVYKTQQEKAQSHLKILSGDEQVQELARMSGGVNITEDTLKHARSLLASRRVS